MKGEWFEVKTAALLYLRGLNSNLEFQLGSNVEQARNFDDIVLKYRHQDGGPSWHTCFMQLKHKERAWLDAAMLTDCERGGFSLRKYLKAFSDIKRKVSSDSDHDLFLGPFDQCDFVIYTNAPMVRELADRRRNVDIHGPVESLLKTSRQNEKIVGFCQETDRDIYQALERSGPEALEFLQKLIVFSGQPSENQMDDVIKEELKVTCRDNMSDVDVIYRFFIDAVKQWWSEDDVSFLSHDSSLLEKALDQYKVFTLSSHEKQTYRLAVRFQVSALENLRTTLDLNESALFVHCEATLLRLCCTKIMQILRKKQGSYTFVGLECLVRNQHTIVHGWTTGPQLYLVVLSESFSEHEKLCKDVYQVLRANPQKRVVIISQRDDSLSSFFKEKFLNTFVEVDESFQSSDLELDSLNHTMNFEINLQGHKTTLQSLLRGGLEEADGIIKKNFVEIIKSKTLSVGDEMREDLEEYSPRYLERRDILKIDVLTSKVAPDLILSNATKPAPQQTVLPGTVNGHRQSYDSTSISDLGFDKWEQDFHRSCLINNNAHWVTVDNKLLLWRRSRGDMKTIREFVDHDKRTAHNPKTTLDLKDRLVVIVEEPPEGKTPLSTYLVNQTKRMHPSVWVVRVNLVDHVVLLSDLPKENPDPIAFLQSVTDVDKSRKFQRDLLQFCLKFSNNIVVCLEKFHEVPEKHRETLCQIVNKLLQTNVLQVIITSSLLTKQMLENRLSTIAYTTQVLDLARKVQQLMMRMPS